MMSWMTRLVFDFRRETVIWLECNPDDGDSCRFRPDAGTKTQHEMPKPLRPRVHVDALESS